MKKWWVVLAVLAASSVQAVSSEFRLLLDLDNNMGTGCVVSTPAGDFAGVETVLTTYVETEGLDQANVVGVERQNCINGSFGPPQAVSAGGWPVGVGNGDDGFHVVETFLPIDLAQAYRDVRVGLVATDELGNVSTLLTRAPGSNLPIVVSGFEALPVPTLGFWLLLLLAVLLLGAGVWIAGRRSRLTLTALVCLSAGGAAGAACLLDGEIFEWSLADRLAIGSATDPESGVDLRSLYGKVGEDGQSLCFRIDTALVFSTPPSAVDDAYLTVETTPLNVAAATGLLANDELGLPDAVLVGFGGGDLSGDVLDHAAGSTVTIGSDGAITVNADGSFEFQADSGFEGDFAFIYRIENISGFSDATVVIEVQSEPVALDDAYEVRIDELLAQSAPGVLANDSGLPAPVVASFGGGDLGGTVDDHTAGSVVSLAPDGSLTLDADGRIEFQPPSDASGDFQFEYRIENAAGTSTATVTITVNVPPQIVSAEALTCEVGQACAFQFEAEGFPAPVIGLDGDLPDGLSFDAATATLAGTPAVGSGALWPLTVSAVNGIEPDAEQDFALTVNEAPTITSADEIGCQVGEPCSFQFTADGFPAPTFDLPGLPDGLILDPVTGELSGTPAAATGGEYSLTLAAANGIAPDDSQPLTLTIGQAPAITSADSLTCEVGQSCDFTFTATGFPAAEFDLPGLPAGLSLDPVSGALSGTPEAGTGAAYSLTLTASNGIAPEATQDFSLTVNEAPSITSDDSLTCQVGQSCSFSFTADGYPAPTFSLPGLPSGLSLDATTGVLSGTPEEDTGAIYNLTLMATNGIAPDDDQAFTLTINEAPSITSADNLVCEVGQSCDFNFTADGHPDPTFSLPGLPAGLSLDPVSGALSGTPEAGTGAAYSLTLTASNGIAPEATQDFSLTVNEAPTITSADSLVCEVGQSCDFTFAADGFPAPEFSLPGLPSGLGLDATTGALTGTPAADSGAIYNLILTASNGIDPDATQGFSLTINEAPTITSADSLTCQVGESCSFTFTADGFPAPTFDLPGLPAGLSVDATTGELIGTPESGTGDQYNLTLTASNGIDPDATQSFSLIINQAPEITSGASLDCEINQACSFQFLATGFPAPQFSLPGLPAGLSLDPVSGQLSGTPEPAAAGTYNLTLTASNGINPAATQAFSIQVGAPPQITSDASFSCTVGASCQFEFTASGVPAPAISLSGSLPDGVSFNAATASLEGTPTAASGGIYALTVEASNGFLPDASQAFTLTVNEAPVAADDPTGGIPAGSAPGDLPYHGPLNTALAVNAAAGVLANDVLGFPVATITTPAPSAANGSVSLAADGSFVYTPNAGFTGLDSFEYCIQNVAASDCAMVIVAIGVRPGAADASYPQTLIGNVSIDTQVSSNLTLPATGDGISLSVATTSNGGGTVRANGTYTFAPTAGHTGAASLTYRVSNGFGDADGVISFNVGNGIWFVDNAQPAGDGRLGSPFNALAPAVGQVNGWPIFIATGSGSYTGGVSLTPSRTLIGQPSAAGLQTITGLTAPSDSVLPAVNPIRPTIVNPGGAGLALGSDNRLYSLEIGNTTGFGLVGTDFGTLTAENLVISGSGGALSLVTGSVTGSGFVSMSSSSGSNNVNLSAIGGTLNLGTGVLGGASGTAFNVVGGAGNVSYAGSITAGSGQRPVNVENKTGGAVALTGQISSTQQGIRLNNNTGATVRFAGGMNLATGADIAFSATGGGTVEVCDENPCNPAAAGALVNSLQTTTGTALNVVDTTIGTNRLEFRSVASNGAASGVILQNTGSAGGLSVTGTGTAGSGGSIQNATVGIQLTSTAGIDLRHMNVPGSSNVGIRGVSVNGLALNNVAVTNTGTALGHHGIFLTDPAGALDLTNVTATGNYQNNVMIEDNTNTGGEVTFNVSGGTYANNNSVNGDSGILINVRGTAVWGPSLVTGASFSMNRVVGLFVVANQTGQINDFNVVNNSFSGSGAAVGQQIGLDMSKSGSSTMTVRAANNQFQGHNAQAMNFASAAGADTGGIYNARIESNTVGNAAVAGSGSRIGNCMRILMQGQAIGRVLVNGNSLRQCPNGRGIEAISRNGTGGTDFTISNNNVNPDDTAGFPLAAIFVQSNAVSVPNSLRANIVGNTVPVGSTFDIVNTYLGLVGSNGAVCQLVGTAASPTAQLTNTNTGSASAGGTCVLIPGPITTPP